MEKKLGTVRIGRPFSIWDVFLGFLGGAFAFLFRLFSSKDKKKHEERRKTILTWGIILGMAFSFVAWGVFAYYMVGLKWPPDWSYGIITDVPGKSFYSIRRPEEHRQFAVQPGQSIGPVPRQHVRGRSAESTPYLPREAP